MANRQKRSHEGARTGQRLVAQLGDDLREARLMAGLRQSDVAAALSTTRNRISRIESGHVPSVPLAALAAHGAVVGLRLHARLYPAGPPLRDQAQVALLDRFRRRLALDWQIRLEAPLPVQGDQRAWDMLLWNGGVTIGVEAISRLRDVQAQVRAAQLKRREADVLRLVLLIAATRANRRALGGAAPLLAAHFQAGTRVAMTAMTAGRDPGGDALVLL